MDMSISKQQRDLLIGLAGVLLLVVIWFLVVTPFKDKKASLVSENETLKPKAEEYQAIDANLSEYENGILNFDSEGAEILSHYPAGIEREDQLMFWTNLGNSYPNTLGIGSIELGEWDSVAISGVEEGAVSSEDIEYDEDGNPVVSDSVANEVQAEYKLFAGVATMDFASTYGGLKDMIAYIQSQNDRNSLDVIQVEYDDETGFLKGGIGVRQYFVEGTDKEYTPSFIPSVYSGVDDIFNTSTGNLDTPREDSNVVESDDNEQSDED